MIREGIKDNSKITSYFSNIYFVTPHYKRLNMTIVMMGLKIYFYAEMWLIIPKLSLLFLILSTELLIEM